MGYPEVAQVVYWLKNAGYRAARGFPGEHMPRIEWPAVAVSLYSADSIAKTRTISVAVCTPTATGGSTCEDLAANVTALLAEYKAACVQGACQYDNWGNFFYVQILATWEEPVVPEPCFQAAIGLQSLPYATAFTAQQQNICEEIGAMGENAPVAILVKEGTWNLTLVEEFPLGVPATEVVSGSFVLTVTRKQTTETYTGCLWTDICREDTVFGMRQTRKAVATGRSVT